MLAVVVSLCVVCGVAALAMNTGSGTKAEQYAREYDGSLQAYEAIFSSQDCAWLQGQFDNAYQSSETSQPGTSTYQRAIGFMKASDERMKEIGCYK